MTPEQYDRWSDFAGRMARHGWPDATEKRRDKLFDAVNWFIDQFDETFDEIVCWDNGPIYVCDEASQFHDMHFHCREDCEQTRFEEQFMCCVRAGFDVAVEPSAGVIGFDVGMLRRMYENDIPDWIKKFFEPPLTGAEPDDLGVWL